MSPRTKTIILLATFIGGCGGGATKTALADKTAEIERVAVKTSAPTSFDVQSTQTEVGFTMEAPLERQEGEVPPSAVSGTIDVDPQDIAKSTGLINVDLAHLVIYQQLAEQEGEYGERTKSDLQNEHMKDWLEIGEDAPAQELEKNELMQFALEQVEDASPPRLDPNGPSEQVVTFTAIGDLRLHQRVTKKRVPMKATFRLEDGHPTSVLVETTEPLVVSLAEHDVRPRTGFGMLAAKTLSAMSPKVAKEAAVHVKISADARS